MLRQLTLILFKPYRNIVTCHDNVTLTNCNTGIIMYLSIGEAAKIAQISRATLYKRNKEGKLSFHTNETGQKVVDTAELSRLYKINVDTVTNRDISKKENLTSEISQVKLQAAQEKIVLLERHIDHLQNTLQHEQSHVTRLLNTSEQLMLTHEQKPKTLLQKFKDVLRFN